MQLMLQVALESAPGVKDIDKIEAFIRHTNS